MGKVTDLIKELDRVEEMLTLLRDGIPPRECAQLMKVPWSTLRGDLVAYVGRRKEKLAGLGSEIAGEVFMTMEADAERIRKIVHAALMELEYAASRVTEDGDLSAIRRCAEGSQLMLSLMKELREVNKLILSMVDETKEAAVAHESRNLSGSGISSVADLCERIRESREFSRLLIEGGVLRTLEAQNAKHKFKQPK